MKFCMAVNVLLSLRPIMKAYRVWGHSKYIANDRKKLFLYRPG